MEKWKALKSLYVTDHLSKTLKSPNVRLSALRSIESLLVGDSYGIIEEPERLNNISKDELKTHLAQKKGVPINSAESSVINGLYHFLPFVINDTIPYSPDTTKDYGKLTVRTGTIKVNTPKVSEATSVSLHQLKKSFEPMCDSDTSILILGTLPGDMSLELGQYYAHPRNRFWKIIAAIAKNRFRKFIVKRKIFCLLRK